MKPRFLPSIQSLAFFFLIFGSFLSSPQSLRVDLVHVDAVVNLTVADMIRRAVQRSQNRLSSILATRTVLYSKTVTADVPVHSGTGEYIMSLAIGTPPIKYTAIVDSGSDLIWTQCQPCDACYPQPDLIFFPALSASFVRVPCSHAACDEADGHRCVDRTCRYTYPYSDGARTAGVLATETFAIGNGVFPGLTFGCSDVSSGRTLRQASGVVGLGRGPLSLVSQLGVPKFMYCLTPPTSRAASRLILGSDADMIRDTANTLTVRMIRNPSYPSYYYINLTGLAVGEKALSTRNTTFAMNGDGSGGMMVHSGTTVTFLENSVYEELVADLVDQISLSRGDGSGLGLDLCFILPDKVSMDRVYVPSVSLAFDGKRLELEKNNLFMVEPTEGLMCLMMSGTQGMSILGNFQQQNMQVQYDLQGETMSFAKTRCGLAA